MPAASKIICPGCRAAFDADTNYCSRCGASLRATPAEDRSRKTEPAMTVPADAAEFTHDDSGPRDPLIGRVIDGRYRVIERLGTGGMGVVYKVEHQRMGKIAAMKVLHRYLAADPEVIRHFRREARAVSKLTHPNTVQTFDFGAADGAMYLVMEYVRGEDLGTLVRMHGPQPFARVAPVFMQVCEALAEAHELGIIHRDLKPENILVTHGKDGHDHAKVLDFGLATLAELERVPAERSAPDLIVGTPLYMSPEQIRADPLDGRADVYSLGAVLYRVLTGEPPFQAQTPVGVLTKHLHDELVPPGERRRDLAIPPQVDEVVTRALTKRREDRFASVEAFREAIGRAVSELSQPPAGVRPHATPQPHRLAPGGASTPQERLAREDFDAFERSLRRRALGRMILVPLVLAAAAAFAILWRSWQREKPRTVELEPNDDLAMATLMDGSVRGKIGQRIAADEGDRDYYRVATGAEPGKPRTLTAEVSAIANIDLQLAVFDRNGRFLAAAQEAKVGGAEKLAGVRVEDDIVYLAVLEKKDSAPVPTENLSDEYTLTVRLK